MTKMNNPKFTTPSGDTAPRQVWQQTVDAVLAQTKSRRWVKFRRRRRAPEYLWAERAAGKKGKPGWLRFLAHFNDVLIYVLLAAAALTAIMGHWVDTTVILGVTVINALIGHIRRATPKNRCRGSATCSPAMPASSVTASMRLSRRATWFRGYRYPARRRPRAGGYAPD